MNDFLAGSLDYLALLRGLLFVLTGIFCFLIRRDQDDHRAYLWLGLFAGGQGAGELAGILTVSLGGDRLLTLLSFSLFFLSFVFLIILALTRRESFKWILLWGFTLIALECLTPQAAAAIGLNYLRLAASAALALTVYSHFRALDQKNVSLNKWRVKMPYTIWIIPSAIIIMIAGWYMTELAGAREDARLRQSVLRRVQTAAAADLLAAEKIKKLTGTEADLGQPYYERIKEQITLVHSVNPDVSFVYFMGQRDGQIFFFVDSEPVDSEDYSPPGQVYPEASQALIEAFKHGQDFTEGPVEDRWGNWISGLKPIIDPTSHQVAAILGMDIDAQDWSRQIALNRVLPIGVTCFITLLLMVFFIVIRLTEEDAARILAAEEDVRLAYDKLKQTETLLIQSAKMSAVGQLAGGVAHEINNPLTSVLANAEIIRRRLSQESPSGYEIAKDFLGLIDQDVAKCKSITGSLIDFAYGAEEGEKAIDLNKAVEGVTALLARNLEQKKIILKKDLAQNLPKVKGNFQLVQQIIFNLIDNACWAIDQKASPAGGEIIVETKKMISGQIGLTVSDDGIGIADQDKGKIFEPFFTTKRIGEGPGLGLSIIYGIIKEQGGEIKVESQPGNGAKFIVTF